MHNINWEEVKDEPMFPIAGGYAAKICKVEDKIDKEYLMVYLDIADGKYKGFCKETEDLKGFWPFRSVWSYKEKARYFFKLRKTAVEETNRGFKFQNDPQSLVGKYCGMILAEEEYKANDGSKKKRMYVAEIISGQKLRDGDFTVPELKKLSEPEAPIIAAYDNYSMMNDDDEKLPF